jgi:hypothetical protein
MISGLPSPALGKMPPDPSGVVFVEVSSPRRHGSLWVVRSNPARVLGDPFCKCEKTLCRLEADHASLLYRVTNLFPAVHRYVFSGINVMI